MTWGRRGADTGENPLTMRDLGSTSEELVPRVSAWNEHGYGGNGTSLRGQTGADIPFPSSGGPGPYGPFPKPPPPTDLTAPERRWESAWDDRGNWR